MTVPVRTRNDASDGRRRVLLPVRAIVHDPDDSEAVLLRGLESAVAGAPSYVVVDLGNTPMLSAAALEALLRIGKDVRERGGELVVRSSHTGLARLMRLTLLTRPLGLTRPGPAPAERAWQEPSLLPTA